jgi:hypothetical protein
MSRYLVSHRIRDMYASQDELINDWRGLRQRTYAEARWVRSLYAAAGQRLYCEWEAESAEAIRACFLPNELAMAPIERIDEVVALDPAWLDEAGSAPARNDPAASAPRTPDRAL